MKGNVEVSINLLEIQAEMLRIDMELDKQNAIEVAMFHGWNGSDKIDLMDLILDHDEVRDAWMIYKSSLGFYNEFMVEYDALGV